MKKIFFYKTILTMEPLQYNIFKEPLVQNKDIIKPTKKKIKTNEMMPWKKNVILI